jgi:sugar phosphate isomerase/epimerase
MQIGIMSRTFVRPTLGEMLDVVKSYGIQHMQFNLSCAGGALMPDRIDPALCDRVRNEMGSRGITIAAVSGTFNMIDPDLTKRQTGLRRLRELAAARSAAW